MTANNSFKPTAKPLRGLIQALGIKGRFVEIETLQEAIAAQTSVNRFLAENEIKDLVGGYGELLACKALGGDPQGAANKGFDLMHPELYRIEVKTRKYELKQDGSVKKESRAVGFGGKKDGFDWLAHIVLDVDFAVVSGCICPYAEAWPEIMRTTEKIGFSTSSRLPSAKDITSQLRTAQVALGFNA